MIKNILEKIDKKSENFIDDLVFGKNEDIFKRNARRIEFKEKYEMKYLDLNTSAWIPIWFAYVNIKNDLKNKEYTKKQKVASIGINIGCELILDAVRFGGIYGIYSLHQFIK